MSEELRPCPFCGVDYYEISGPQELGAIVVCNECGASAKSIVDWNTRPIEDALRAERDRAREMVTRLIETGRPLCDYAILVSFDHPMGDGQMALNDKSAWDALVTEWQKERETC